MTCEEVMELMQRSLDGDLNASETSRMMEHIRTCPECAVLLERLTRLSDNLAQLPRVTPRISIVDSILPRLESIDPEAFRDSSSAQEDEAGNGHAALPAARRRRPYRRLAASIAAGIAAGLLIVAMPQLQSSHSDKNSFDAASSVAGGAESSGSAADAPEASSGDALKTKLFSARIEDPSQAESAPAQPSGSPEAGDSSQANSQDHSSGVGGQAIERNLTGDAATPPATKQPAQADGETHPFTSLGAAEDGQAANQDTAVPSASASAESSAPAQAPIPDTKFGDSSGGAFSFAQQTEWTSPDGKYRAAVEDNRLRVYLVSDGKLLFQSEAHPDSAIGDVVWDEDSGVLHYVWTNASGQKTKLEWTAATGEETADEAAGEASPSP